ncbi:MAG: hypothetical protein LBG05_07745 [Treponema sp.]|jgi:hypothetical protein|nr:hypothetical protein [Treponema sp.]
MREPLSVFEEKGTKDREQGIRLQPESLFQRFLIFLSILLSSLCSLPSVPAEEPHPKARPLPPSWAVWYLSNSAGMAVSPAPSRLAALRNKNCLALAIVGADSLPPTLVPYYRSSLTIDFRMLFENGKPIREQWVFRDEKGRGLVIAAAVIGQDADPTIVFIERYSENGSIEEERLFDQKETHIKYSYKGQILVRTETRIWEKREKEKPPVIAESQPEEIQAEAPPPEFETVETTVYTDYYRYSASNSLRAVERVFQKGKPESGQFLIAFPPLTLRQEIDHNFVQPASTNHSDFLAGDKPVSNVRYTIDGRGRVLTETHHDENGSVLVEMKNTWGGGGISVIEQQFFENLQDVDLEESAENGEDKPEKRGEVIGEKRVEYEYDSAGDRVLEKNYNNGALERTIRKNGNQEIEEIYLEGKVVLRSIWEGNKKIKEERVR